MFRIAAGRVIALTPAFQADELLGVECLATGRITQGVGKAVVHGRQARRARIAWIMDLHGGGAPGKDAKSIEACVPGHIDERVDPIAPYCGGGLIVRLSNEWPPMRRARAKSLGTIVFYPDVRVAI